MCCDRLSSIRSRLVAEFSPQELDIIDESQFHIGHPGARDGRGHFKVRIVSSRFEGTRPIDRHRMVYEALGDLMRTDIHALSVIAHPPSTATSPKTSS